MKTCSRCKTTKKLTEFYKKKVRRDKLSTYCKICDIACAKDWYERNKIKVAASKKQYYQDNREQELLRKKQFYQTHKEKKKLYAREYCRNNRKAIKAYKKQYQKNRLKTDSTFKLAANLRSRLSKTFKGNYKSGSAIRDLGCSISSLKLYLGTQFYDRSSGEKMSWDNYGLYGWHIDHIQSLDSFDLQDRGDFLTAVHWTNLQPLWAEDNFRKGNN